MIKPKIPLNEKERLAALKSYDLLDTASENTFDSLTKLAAMVCDVPVSLISLVDQDRQWFKSKFGLGASETPREVSFCGHAINQTETFYVEDATKDDRFKDNPLVVGNPNVIFYAGTPLIDDKGLAIGTLCVIDNKPRSLSSHQLEQLKIIGDQAIYLIQSRVAMKKKEEALSLLTKLAENLPGFIYTYQLFSDGSSCFPFSSNLIEEIFEVTSEELKVDSSKFFSRIHPDDIQNVANSIRESAITMTKCSCDYRVVLPTLGEKWIRGNANPEKALDGSILWHGFISDITELKKQEDIINHTLKMASLGEMAAGIAHEINNPLTIIKGTSQQISTSLKRDIFEKEKFIRYAEKIETTTDRIAKIIRGLKFFSNEKKMDNFQKESIFNIVEDTISLCSEKFKINNIDFKFKYSEDSAHLLVECHAVEISQVLLNLLNNAFDAIEIFDEKWIELEILNHSDVVTISIMDCGNGIDKEEVAKILTPFYTTKAVGKGTGLGLSISHRIIENHKGKLWIDETCPNTKFVVEIPKIHENHENSLQTSA